MPDAVNRRWLLAKYPQGTPSLDTWTLEVAPAPEPGPGQILVKARFLSVDPYMRGRISPAANYAKSVALGEVLRAAVFHTSVDTSFYLAGHRGIFEPIFLSVVALPRT